MCTCTHTYMYIHILIHTDTHTGPYRHRHTYVYVTHISCMNDTQLYLFTGKICKEAWWLNWTGITDIDNCLSRIQRSSASLLCHKPSLFQQLNLQPVGIHIPHASLLLQKGSVKLGQDAYNVISTQVAAVISYYQSELLTIGSNKVTSIILHITTSSLYSGIKKV